MPKFVVTQNMGAALRNLRQKRNIKAIDVAKSIDKTGAYISKLEKGILNTIERDDFLNIVKTLSKNENEFNEAIELLLKDTSMEFSKEEADNEEWKMNVDLFYRKFSIPQEYLSIVRKKITDLNISIPELVSYINANSDLYSNEKFDKTLLDSSDKNRWIFNNGNSFIVVEVTEDDLESVIYKDGVATNYSMLLCILVSLFRLEKYSHDEAYKEAHKILSDLKIQTLTEKEAIMKAYDKKNEMHTVLDQRENSELPEEDRKLLTFLYSFTKRVNSFAQMHDVEYVNKRMSTMTDNLKNDPILFMGYIGINLEKLKDCDFQIKKEFVKAVKDLVEEYSVKQPIEKKEELI